MSSFLASYDVIATESMAIQEVQKKTVNYRTGFLSVRTPIQHHLRHFLLVLHRQIGQ